MANVYNSGMEGVSDQTIDWVNDTINCVLLKATPTFDATDATMTAVIASGNTEADCSGYARTALAATKSVALNGNTVEFKCGNTTFSSLGSGNTIYGAVIVKYVDGSGSDIPISYHDTNDLATNGSDIVFNPTSGVCWTIVNA